MESPVTDNGVKSFKQVHEVERQALHLAEVNKIDGIGLALSGGGIRSASFALGVVQVLLTEGLFRRFDYLSTVSGGGYLGCALSWWLHRAATGVAPSSTPGALTPYQAFRQQLGSKVTGSRTQSDANPSPWRQSNWLAYIRQHGNYLMPRGVGYASLAATVLRVCLYTLFVYGIALLGIFCLFASLSRWALAADLGRLDESTPHFLVAFFDVAKPYDLLETVALVASLAFAVLLVLISWVYGPATWVASRLGDRASSWLYAKRTDYRRYLGVLLSLTAAAILVTGISFLANTLSKPIHAAIASLSSLSLGSIGAAYQFLQGRAQSKTPSWVSELRIVGTAALVIYGLSVGAYALSQFIGHNGNPLYWGLGAIAFSCVFGFFVNSNFAGLSRLYRDRLMEVFLPDLAAVANNEWQLAETANVQRVADMAGRLTCQGELETAKQTECQRPLHLINCNVVLMDSDKDLYRNRGGDSFSISQLFAGSNATHWIETGRLGDGSMTLATAMSISGAAANPNAAPNGLGITRNRLVSFLMSLFDVRLGYWMSNPRLTGEKPSNRPNLWLPGFRQGLLAQGLSEKARFLELTDGGHFDNTALYELIRRRTRLIVVSQAGCDPNFTMEDLANVIEKVRVDFSVFIEFDDLDLSLEVLRLQKDPPFTACKRGYAIGRIRYPIGTPTSPEFEDGWLVYLQAVPASLSADITSYWRRHTDFPNDTTADQFFSEENVEAYRELGYAIANHFYKDLSCYARAQAKNPAVAGTSKAFSDLSELLFPEGPPF